MNSAGLSDQELVDHARDFYGSNRDAAACLHINLHTWRSYAYNRRPLPPYIRASIVAHITLAELTDSHT